MLYLQSLPLYCFLSLDYEHAQAFHLWREKMSSIFYTNTLFFHSNSLLQRSVYETITTSLVHSHSLFNPLHFGFHSHLNHKATSAEGRGGIHITQSNMEFLDFGIHAITVSLSIDHTSFSSPLFFGICDITSPGSLPTSEYFFSVIFPNPLNAYIL